MFARPDGSAEVWCERAFEVVLDGVWQTGVFDRVVVERDAANRPIKAWVIDFKTDRTGGVVGKHTEQLNAYRRVVTVLTGVPLRSVRCTLVLTARAMAVDVPTAE